MMDEDYDILDVSSEEINQVRKNRGW